ncbi:DUF5719 family protein [Tessaracoccus flavus]|uniref:Uncharacterized protein n=1 Tax=Tessaracoccus flavus TaxID=1610493 RepID=A0A1Q2CFW7_9ACTN|nr:DUF5719 family protein [Tessaracoccus flavus]AQP45008.1 hypothetical protein RPIT_09590 [Tessaracoccus flavus]SDY59457.1 hypothetical protein SAMN05428934_102388 [Tessaracoccus flavus]
MIRRTALSLAALLAVVAVAALLALLSPARQTPPVAVDLPQTSRVVCLVAGRVLVRDVANVEVRGLSGNAESAEGGELTIDEPVVLRAERRLAAGVLVEQEQRSYAPCQPAVTSGMVVVADPASTELILANADGNEATVDLTLLGADGEVVAVGARGIALAPGSTRRVALSVLAPDGPVGVAFRASQGRVALIGAAVEGRPTRFTPPSDPSTEHVVGGIPAGATAVQLLVSNPHENRVEVSVEALGASASFEPASATGISVAPRSTMAIDLGDALAGEAAALQIAADQAVGVSVVAGVGAGSPATLTGGVASSELSLNAPGGSALVVSNPGDGEATVDVSVGGADQQLTVDAGLTVAVPLPEGGQLEVDLSADSPVVAAAVSATEAGTVVVPAADSVDAAVRGVPARLDPTLR